MASTHINHHRPMRASAWLLAAFLFLQSFLPGLVMAHTRSSYALPKLPVQHLFAQLERALPAPVATHAAEMPAVPAQQAAVAAIPGGPDQPEVKSFTPVGTSDMVNPFTGDFSYNIPLLDVDGYPINIAYNAGITMDQEASWVGLGWNLNPGVVNRVMRGLPDDFNGSDKIVKQMNLKGNFTVGVSGAVGIELFGVDDDVVGGNSLSASLGVNYNNYNGFGAEVGITPSFALAGNNKPDLNFQLGISGSSTGGATLRPTVSLSSEEKNDKTTTSKQMNIGTSMNSRKGVSGISFNYSKRVHDGEKKKNDKDQTYVKISSSTTRAFSSSYNLGMNTYTPSLGLPMNSGGGTISVKIGVDIVGLDGTAQISGYFNKQWLKEPTRTSNAYGYMFLQNGQRNHDALLDFNRENDGAFTKNTPALAVPSLTYDLFNVSGQGVSGSYRLYRDDIGYVFDPSVGSNSVDGSLGLELGVGGTFKGGVDIGASYSNSHSQVWENPVTNKLRFQSSAPYFREANEMSVSADPTHFDRIGGGEAVRFNNPNPSTLQNILEFSNNEHLETQNGYRRQGQDRRNQVIYTLNRKELEDQLGVQAPHPDSYDGKDHHLAQFTTLNMDGTRYVYGIAAYNLTQRDVSFAMGSGTSGVDCDKGLISYQPADASTGNSNGIDNYFNAVTTPAYAHSYLLTSVLNADYVDVSLPKGPSPGDLGGYIQFSYDKISNYKWRSPVPANKALYDEGLNTDQKDNKAHYIYGEKELWYVKTIETKNHIAVFFTSPRSDGHAVNGEAGGVAPGNPSMMKLDSIQLFERNAYALPGAVPLKTVHFFYDYSQCLDYPQNVNETASANTPESGKLTLRKIWFTYQNSKKGKQTPYVFDYGFNPGYNLKNVDRWGTYKESSGNVCQNVAARNLLTSDYPYTGFDAATVDLWAEAWNLKSIQLPSGGKMEVLYESDDYAYVQHLQANQMFRIVGVELPGDSVETSLHSAQSVSNTALNNAKIYFELMPGYTNIGDYVNGLKNVYFRALMKFDEDTDGYDFVPGYAELDSYGIDPTHMMGWLKLKPAKLNDNSNAHYNPIAVAGIQYGRRYLSRILPPSNQSVDEGASILDLAEAILGAFQSVGEMFTGPNRALWDKKVGTDLVIGNSWVRLMNPNGKKLGGGHRVKEIRLYDAWEQMTANETQANYYGQQYEYLNEKGNASSGVASYEPQLGNDENPWRQPIANNVEYLLAPDERNYQETPFGEQFFPSPVVGYSRVTVKNLPRTGVKRTATGSVVHEFYTAKDFPTFTGRTYPQIERFELPVFAFFFNLSIDEMSASQGFVVENNDMHGKPRSQRVYQEGGGDAISSVEYEYQAEAKSLNAKAVKHLTSNATVIRKDGTTGNATLGLTYEAVADFRQSTSLGISGSLFFNLNYTTPFILVPTILGSGSMERTAFRSATFTKVIERFGILTKTTATDLGSTVATSTLAYDAETGAPLLTEVNTDFDDKVYNFTYPAHWYYEGMGQAYKNIDLARSFPSGISFASGTSTGITQNDGFFPGDEVACSLTGQAPFIGWVTAVTPTSVTILKKDGTAISGTLTKIKVVRSGRRNIQTTSIGGITLQTNPLTNLTGNVFDRVLQAGAVEYSENWRTFCSCFGEPGMPNYSENPYVLGTKGHWRPKASYTHLSNRTQAFANANSNVRKDGVFASYRPFYRLSNGQWVLDKQNWTYASSVTEFSPFGQPLETVDALNRYSASQYGFHQTLATAVAVNTRYSQLGFDSYEDYNDDCADDHFRPDMVLDVVNTHSHTGRKSVHITPTTSVTYFRKLETNCDPVGCSMRVGTKKVDSTNDQMTILGGTAPYTIDYEIIQGITGFSIIDAGNGFNIAHGTNWSIRVTVTDAAGCSLVQTYGNATF